MSKYRYPGIHSFTAAERGQFFGRERETKELFRLLMLNPVVVLFGKSGTGKTSLLQAGVSPLLQERLLQPVKIRLNDTSKPVSRQIWEQFNEAEFLPLDTPDDLSLAEYCRRFDIVEGGEALSPVLLLDQFEELFTLYGELPEQREQFIGQLAELLQVSTASEGRSGAPGIRVVISIRSDFLYLLDRISTQIPAILRCRYELNPLDETNARRAITAPAGLPGDFDSQSFSYSPAALNTILDGLTAQSDAGVGTREVEAFLLQQFCQRIESKLVAENTGAGFEVTPDFFGGKAGIEALRDAFYADVLAKFEPATRLRVQRLVEEKLISAERRIIQERENIKNDLGLRDADLAALCRERLLLEEPRGGSYYYEISHDTLLAPILRARTIRREAEERAENTRRIRRLTIIALLLGLVVAGAVSLAVWAIKQRDKAENALQLVENEKKETEKQRQKAEENQDAAIKNAKEAQQNLSKVNIANQLPQTNLEKAKTEEAKAKKALGEVVSLNLKEAKKLVFLLDYDNALEKLKTAAVLDIRQQEVSEALLEHVYFFAETGANQRARGVLDTAARLVGRKLSDFGKLENREDFRRAIQSCSPARLDSLDARYFPVMVDIPGGNFMMGTSVKDEFAENDEQPQHQVTVSSFKMARTETTWWQYYLYCCAAKEEIPEKPGWGGEGDNPVIDVTWYDAVGYARWLNAHFRLPQGIDGEEDNLQIHLKAGYRLPTEAEWEYAARAGTTLQYSGSNTLDSVGWYEGNSRSRTNAVAQKKANAFGLYDMSGNVFEWCWDRYDPYQPEALVNPAGPDRDYRRVCRGGGWGFYARSCRSARRAPGAPGALTRALGFRLVSSV